MLHIVLLFIYSAFSQSFTELQRLSEPTQNTNFVDISSDNNIMVTGNGDNQAYHYQLTNGIFTHQQNITDSGNDVMVTDITSDGQSLLAI